MPSVLGLICVFLCLSFNLTFPMHRDSRWIPFEKHYVTNFKVCTKDISQYQPSYRTKKTVPSTENTMEKIKVSSDVGKKFENKDTSNNKLNDMSHYEQLVFMKKYPYLDLKDYEMKYRPASNKVARESVEFESGTNLRSDSSLCEPLEEGPNVEILNRGLSGFNIPARNINGEVITNEKLKQDLKPQY